MSKKNSLEAKMLRREQRAIRKRDARVDKVQKWIPVNNKYGNVSYMPVLMPAGMFK